MARHRLFTIAVFVTSLQASRPVAVHTPRSALTSSPPVPLAEHPRPDFQREDWQDRKSTRLNSSHVRTSYAVFCLKKKNYLENQEFPRPAVFSVIRPTSRPHNL